MHKSILLFSALLISTVLLILSCGRSDNLTEWKYNFIVKDVLTDEPLEGVELRLLQHFGGSALLHDATSTTNSKGEARLISLIDENTLAADLKEGMFDPSIVWQELYVTSSFFRLQQIEQNGEVLATIRKHFEQEIEITVYVWKAAQVNLTFSDVVNTNLYNDVILKIRASHADKDFVYNIGNPGSQSSEWLLKIPAEKDVTFSWEVYEGPDYSDVSLVDSQGDTLNLKFEQVIDYIIEH